MRRHVRGLVLAAGMAVGVSTAHGMVTNGYTFTLRTIDGQPAVLRSNYGFQQPDPWSPSLKGNPVASLAFKRGSGTLMSGDSTSGGNELTFFDSAGESTGTVKSAGTGALGAYSVSGGGMYSGCATGGVKSASGDWYGCAYDPFMLTAGNAGVWVARDAGNGGRWDEYIVQTTNDALGVWHEGTTSSAVLTGARVTRVTMQDAVYSYFGANNWCHLVMDVKKGQFTPVNDAAGSFPVSRYFVGPDSSSTLGAFTNIIIYHAKAARETEPTGVAFGTRNAYARNRDHTLAGVAVLLNTTGLANLAPGVGYGLAQDPTSGDLYILTAPTSGPVEAYLSAIRPSIPNDSTQAPTYEVVDLDPNSENTYLTLSSFLTDLTNSSGIAFNDPSGNGSTAPTRLYICSIRPNSTYRSIYALDIAYTAPSETVSVPTGITGPTSTYVGKSENYTGTGALSSLGHTVEYRFDWGDGSTGAWGNASHVWSGTGPYDMKAQARCAGDTVIESDWSGTLLSVTAGYLSLTTTVNPESSGTVTKAPDTNQYTYGQSVQLTAAAGGGYYWNSWSGDASGFLNPLTISVTNNMSVTANFDSTPETVSDPTAVAGITNTFSGKSENYTASGSTSDKGHSVQYRFDWGDSTISAWGSATQSHSWSNAGVYAIGAQARCSVDTAVESGWASSMLAVDVSNVTLTVSVNPGASGTVTKNPDKAGYLYNESVQLTANPGGAYYFSFWSGDASGTANPTTISMNAHKNVTANFLPLPVTQRCSYSFSLRTIGDPAGPAVLDTSIGYFAGGSYNPSYRSSANATIAVRPGVGTVYSGAALGGVYAMYGFDPNAEGAVGQKISGIGYHLLYNYSDLSEVYKGSVAGAVKCGTLSGGYGVAYDPFMTTEGGSGVLICVAPGGQPSWGEFVVQTENEAMGIWNTGTTGSPHNKAAQVTLVTMHAQDLIYNTQFTSYYWDFMEVDCKRGPFVTTDGPMPGKSAVGPRSVTRYFIGPHARERDSYGFCRVVVYHSEGGRTTEPTTNTVGARTAYLRNRDGTVGGRAELLGAGMFDNMVPGVSDIGYGLAQDRKTGDLYILSGTATESYLSAIRPYISDDSSQPMTFNVLDLDPASPNAYLAMSNFSTNMAVSAGLAFNDPAGDGTMAPSRLHVGVSLNDCIYSLDVNVIPPAKGSLIMVK